MNKYIPVVKHLKSNHTAVINCCICAIIVFVYFASFGGLWHTANAPVMKGCTGEDNIALQIMVDSKSDIDSYIDVLERANAKGTFFFCTLCQQDDMAIEAVRKKGHGVGYYVCDKHTQSDKGMYVGGGHTIPVMQYKESGNVRLVAPSIDLRVLTRNKDWPKLFEQSLRKDMFVGIFANNICEFEKAVQIVSDKGYTILKINEMLFKENTCSQNLGTALK